MVELSGVFYDDAGVAINAAPVAVFATSVGADESTGTGSATATTTTSAAGLWAFSALGEERYDVRITTGSTIRWRRQSEEVQVEEIETSNLLIRNPADTFVYDIVPAAIAANRTLNLPLITGTDTLATLGLAQTFTADQTFNDNVKVTLGTGGDVDFSYDGTDLIINPIVAGSGHMKVGANVEFSTGQAVIAADYIVGRDADGTNQIHLNVPSGATIELSVNDVAEMVLSASALDLQNNNLNNVGAAGHDITSAGVVMQSNGSVVTGQNSTNAGVQYVGGGRSGVSVQDNETFTFVVDNGAAFIVFDASNDSMGFFFCNKASVMVQISDPDNKFDITDTDSNPGIAVFKSTASTTVSIKNYTNGTITLAVIILGPVASATAPS